MENYEKAETIEIDVDHAALFQRLPQLPDNPVVMKVRGSSKIQSLLDVAIAKLKVLRLLVQASLVSSFKFPISIFAG